MYTIPRLRQQTARRERTLRFTVYHGKGKRKGNACRLCCNGRGWVILHLLENAEKCDEKVEAIHHEPDANKTDEGDLVVTERIADVTFDTIDAIRQGRAWEGAVPRDS